MTSAKRILLVSKVPAASRLAADDRRRLDAAGMNTVEQVLLSQREHDATLSTVRQKIYSYEIIERTVDTVSSEDLLVDLVICVGGDGTVLAVNRFIHDIPIIAVNSDPNRSVGHYTRCTAETFSQLFESWENKSAQSECLHRLLVSCGAHEHHVLNDCLFTNANPGAITRYRMFINNDFEDQRSSGIWFSTGSGSSAAIHSAGFPIVNDTHNPMLLYKVREPYMGHKQLHLIEGRENDGIDIIPSIPGIRLYLDGSFNYLPLETGSRVSVRIAQSPIHLLIIK